MCSRGRGRSACRSTAARKRTSNCWTTTASTSSGAGCNQVAENSPGEAKEGSVTSQFVVRLAVVTALVVMGGQKPATTQSQNQAERESGASFTPARTPWGDPDLQGHWLPGGGFMMEAPSGEPWKGNDPSSGGTNAAFSRF